MRKIFKLTPSDNFAIKKKPTWTCAFAFENYGIENRSDCNPRSELKNTWLQICLILPWNNNKLLSLELRYLLSNREKSYLNTNWGNYWKHPMDWNPLHRFLSSEKKIFSDFKYFFFFCNGFKLNFLSVSRGFTNVVHITVMFYRTHVSDTRRVMIKQNVNTIDVE